MGGHRAEQAVKPYWQSADGAASLVHALQHIRCCDIVARMTEWLRLATEQAARFWTYVDKSGACWMWTGGKDKDGYGRFSITAPRGANPKQKHVRAHRLSWEFVHGAARPDRVVMHSCDNPGCVNLDHLSQGTQGQNREDCGVKGRNARGLRNGAYTRPEKVIMGVRHYEATLTEEQVRQVRALRAEGVRPKVISDRLGIGFFKVWGIVSGRTWKSVK